MNIVITGASKGIGRAIVHELSEMECHFYVNARTEKDLINLKNEVEKIPNKSTLAYSICDVRNSAEVKSFADKAFDHFGHIDVLINNAGVFIPGALHEEDEDNLHIMMETNLYSAYHLSRAVIPHMKSLKKGQIINICSIASIQAYENGGSYAVSKFALLGMTKCLRQELKRDGIRVNAILPGATWSDSWKGAGLPEDRIMKASDIAKVVRNCIELSPNAVIEDVVIRPLLGDL